MLVGRGNDDVTMVVALPYFDSLHELRRINETLPRWMPIIGVDGRYKFFPSDHDYSVDGSTEFLKKRPHTVIDQFCGDQVEKRQRYLDIAGDLGYDYVLVMDTDEYIKPGYTDWDLFFAQLQATAKLRWDDYLFGIWYWVQPPDRYNPNHNQVVGNSWHTYVRIMREPKELRYFLTHYKWRLKEDNLPGVSSLKARFTIDGIRLTADSLLRMPQYTKSSDGWALDNLAYEDRKIWMYQRGLQDFAPLLRDELIPNLRLRSRQPSSA